ncbi:MAG: excinuclease ABC subunit UvrA [Patescibacteria group bacterium]|nr:excinuclease ABC subunit UvrA [Patescibacteria group bacterium]
MAEKLIIKGAKVHNLKNVSVVIPKNKLVVITGLSGSGKSSLAFDTIYAEGQRRYAESLSSYARQFMDIQDKPDVSKIEGLSPTIAIDQRLSTQNPRSTVGTVTEIYDYLRLLFARAGKQHCPDCGEAMETHTSGVIAEEAKKIFKKSGEILILSPVARDEKINTKILFNRVEKTDYEWLRVNGKLLKIKELESFNFDLNKKYKVELLICKVNNAVKQNIAKAVDEALDLSNGLAIIAADKEEKIFSTYAFCPKCGKIAPALDIRSFSFNSPYGACPRCTGLGVVQEADPDLVIPNKKLTLAEGAVQPWVRITGSQVYYQKVLKAVSEKRNFSLDIPVGELPAPAIKIIFYGTGKDTYEVDGKKIIFEGVLPNLTQRYLETDSDYVRKEIEEYMRESVCPVCKGRRLRRESLAVKLGDYNIADISGMEITDSVNALLSSKAKAGTKTKAIFESIVKEAVIRLENLSKVGLDYLSLDRSLTTLSRGEAARVRLSAQLSAGLSGVIYVLDEPSVGLHPRDTERLIATLKSLRDLGNTVIVVEHDAAMTKAADYIIDVGPGAGVFGGEIVAEGALSDIKKSKKSLTGAYLSERIKIEPPAEKKISKNNKSIKIIDAKAFNLKNVTVSIPLGKLVCVSGASGSGKSTLVIDVLGKALARHFYRAKDEPGEHKKIEGFENIDKVITIDQSPIGRTPRSNPATYTGVFTLIRDLFASLSEAKMRGYDAGKFSFNVKGGGRCEACAGEGYIRVPMQFLADVFVECEQCGGTRYNQEALEIHYQYKNIADVLKMTVEEAYKFFNNIPQISDKLNVLREVGLGYIQLGQPATNLSGGEAQRVKLSTELSRAATGNTLYILDEPTTGLHFEDVKHLLEVLYRLVAKGNTVLLIEHNLEVIKCADWVIDMGPEGGKRGGEVVAIGSPKDIMKSKTSWTGKFLKKSG